MDFCQNPFGLEEYLFIIQTGFLDNSTPGSIKKATKYGMTIYLKVKTSKLHFDNLSIRVSQSKTTQVETIYTFKNYLYIAHPVSSHKIKLRRFV